MDRQTVEKRAICRITGSSIPLQTVVQTSKVLSVMRKPGLEIHLSLRSPPFGGAPPPAQSWLEGPPERIFYQRLAEFLVIEEGQAVPEELSEWSKRAYEEALSSDGLQ